MNVKEILLKLINAAEKRQQIIHKLAQIQNDPNINYLQQAWQTAALNSGITHVSTPKVSFNTGGVEDNVQIGDTYTVVVSGIPAKEQIRQKLINTFKTQVKNQKPDLDGKVSIIFN